MSKGRLEAFSDGVLAIIITIMVLELKVPHQANLAALLPLLPVFTSYLLSFIYIGIYWNNHHHMLHAVQHVNGKVLWANMHLLFWLSLVPFATAWMGENHFSQWPVVLYGFVLLMAGISYYILSQALVRMHGRNSALAAAIGSDLKGKLSVVIYLAAILLSFVHPWISMALYALVATIWFIPDKRIERRFENEEILKD
ncbi:MAG TPA: TMEM175 family protein [Phnomibacter sp.]|nr:TMEM175 family protein [Phnomibacter sp.]